MGIRLRESLAAEQREKFFAVPPAHGCVVFAFGRTVAKIAPSFDDLFGRTTADSQLQTSSGNEIRRASILRHVVRVLIPHVDHCGADFNASRLRADRGEQRERGRQLPCEMMNTKVRSVHSQALGLHREVNGLQQCVSPGSRL